MHDMMLTAHGRRLSTLCSIVLCLILCFPAVTVAQHEAAIEQARSLIESLREVTGTPGVTVSVGIREHIVWSEGFGYADLEQRVPARPDVTRFRVGSISKLMTAAAVGQLYEQGRLDIDAPIQDYVPSFPCKPEGTITTRLLAGHVAGIRHYRNDEFLNRKHYLTVLESLDIFKDDPLLHPPGSKLSYSTYGWNLIGAAVEGASGDDFLTYMSRHVFLPVGMDCTTADDVTRIIEDRTRYYEWRNGCVSNTPPVDNSCKWAGGGFLSTSEDLVRFGFAHLDSSLLRSETVRLLWTPQYTTDGTETGYGIGWLVSKDDRGRRLAWHYGGAVGGTTVFCLYPDSRIVIAVIFNMSGVRYGNVADKLADLFSGIDVPKSFGASLLTVVLNDGVTAAMDHYAYLKRSQYGHYNFDDERELSGVGYGLLARERIDEAIAIFELNAAEFPASPVVFDNLGDACAEHGRLEQAERSYKQAIENAEAVNHPYLQEFREKLERVRKRLSGND